MHFYTIVISCLTFLSKASRLTLPAEVLLNTKQAKTTPNKQPKKKTRKLYDTKNIN
jgi:hypothetical protein